MMRAALSLALLAPLVVASPCNEIGRGNGKEAECKSLGCKWAGNRCGEPDFCRMGSRKIQYGGREVNSFEVLRPPLNDMQASLCSPQNHPECSAIYRVTVQPAYTSGPPNCNDLGMLPPHGRNQKLCADPATNGLSPAESKYWENNDIRRSLKDYEKHPFPADAIKQSVAAGANAHTALMEETRNCHQMDSNWQATTDDTIGDRNKAMSEGGLLNENCAFPLGFYKSTILKNKAVCVMVQGTEGRWVEIMAASAAGSSGGSFCVSDWGPEGDEQACTKEGDLYECREAGRSQSGSETHEMRLKFQAFDNIDDAQMEIHWRVVASKLPEGTTGEGREEKDAEDWCQFRDAADFPMTLMGAYPKGFRGNPVFDVKVSSGSRLVPALAAVLAAAAAAVFAC